MESVDSIVIIGAASASIFLTITGVGLIISPMRAGIACALSLGNEIIHEMILNNYSKCKKVYKNDHQTNKSFDKLYRKSLGDNVIDKNE